MKKITTKEAVDLIYKYGSLGETFSVVFKLKGKNDLYDKEMKKPFPDPDVLLENKDIWREMTCRLGVKKGVKGVGQSYNPDDYRLITVYDMGLASKQVKHPELLEPKQLKGLAFRNIPIDNIVWLGIHGEYYLVIED